MASDVTGLSMSWKANGRISNVLNCLRHRAVGKEATPTISEGAVDSSTVIESCYTNYEEFCIMRLESLGLVDDIHYRYIKAEVMIYFARQDCILRERLQNSKESESQ